MASSDERFDWRPLLAQPRIRALTEAESPCAWHLVGGVLRDAVLGRDTADVDLTVERGGEHFAEGLAARLGGRLVRLGGDRFAAYRIVDGPFRIDLWDREGGSLEADLERRDFTVNSMALEPATAQLVDPHGGLTDLAGRRLRATTAGSFSEDPVRVLRLARFAAELGFEIEPHTLDLARGETALAAAVGERVRDELRQLLTGTAPERGLECLSTLGVWPRLWSGATDRAVSADRLLESASRLLLRLRELQELGTRCAPGDRYVALQALLFQAAGGDDGAAAAELATGWRRRRRFSGGEERAVRRLLAARPLPSSTEARRWFLHEAGEGWPARLALCDLEAPGDQAAWRAAARSLAELATADGDAIFSPPPLLDGHEVSSLLGLPAGPRLGELVVELRRAQIEGRVASRRAAERLLRELAAAATTPSASG